VSASRPTLLASPRSFRPWEAARMSALVRSALGWARRGERGDVVRSHRGTVAAERGEVPWRPAIFRTRFERFQGLAAPFPSERAAVRSGSDSFCLGLSCFLKSMKGWRRLSRRTRVFARPFSANESSAASLKWADPKELVHPLPGWSSGGFELRQARMQSQPAGKHPLSARTRFEPMSGRGASPSS